MPIEILHPANRDEWLRLRQPDVTASEIGCLVDSEHPWITPLKLWNIKTGRLVPDNLDSPVKRRGRKLELVGAEETAERLPGAKIEHNTANTYWRDSELRIGCTPDLIVHDPERGLGVVELKNPGVGVYAKKWENGEPPLSYALQTLVAGKLVGAEWAAIGVLRVNDFTYDFDLVPIPLANGAWTALTNAVKEFWHCVESNIAPEPNYSRDLAVISSMYPMDDGTTIDLSHDNELIHALVERERVKEMIKAAQDNCDAYDALIKHKAGVHELIIAGDYRVVLKTQQISGYTVKPRIQRSLRIKKLGARPEAAA